MSNKIFVVVIVVFVIFSAFALADSFVTDYSKISPHVRSVERITNYDPRIQDHKWQDTVHLTPPGSQPVMARGYNKRMAVGTAFVSTNQAYNPPIAQGGVWIKVTGLDSTYKTDKLYEGWLVDEKDNYWLSLGVFSTDNFGNGRLNQATATGNMPAMQRLYHVLDLYDAVAVTLEPYPDNDPRPSGNVVLYGEIKKPAFFNVPPNTQQKLWGSTKSYKSSSYNNPIAQMVGYSPSLPVQSSSNSYQ